MLSTIASSVRKRFVSLRADENGMEAAQVILILAIVVVVLVPVIGLIVNALKTQGTNVTNGINNIKPGQ